MFKLHSLYQAEKMQIHLKTFNSLHNHDQKNYATYNDFKKAIPMLTENALSEKIAEFISNNNLQSCSFSMTSGTTGNSKLLVNSLWRNGNQAHYAAYFKKIMETYVLSKTDVVANLFTAGGFSTLYDGCNRLLEGVGCHLLPIGRLDHFSLSVQYQMISKMQQVGLNVLFGTPSSIIYLLKLSEKSGVGLNIKKIVFTGEPFSREKRDFVKIVWPYVNIYGLYGHSETGFVGFNTPQCENQHYHYFSDWFFLEVIHDDELLVTSYADTLMPIIRYQVGDRAALLNQPCACGINLPILSLQGRKDKKFNFAGNLISSDIVKNKLSELSLKDVEFQIQLRSDQEGRDQLTLFLSKIRQNKIKDNELYAALLQIDELCEAIQKQAGVISIKWVNDFVTSERQKQPVIIDYRIGEAT